MPTTISMWPMGATAASKFSTRQENFSASSPLTCPLPRMPAPPFNGGAGIRGSGHVNGELAEKFSCRVENLDAAVAPIGHIDIVVGIDGDAVRRVELARPRSRLAPRHQPVALLIHFGDSRIDVAV